MTNSDESRTNPAKAAKKLHTDAEILEEAVEDIPRPFTSYAIIGNLAQTQESLSESLDELSQWYERAEEGIHYQDVNGEGTEGATNAAARLEEAAALADQLKNTLHEALEESGKVRSLDSPSDANDTGIDNDQDQDR